MATSKYYNLDVDTTLGGNASSDYVAPSQKAIKTYVDNAVSSGLPAQTDNAGKFLTTDGTDASWSYTIKPNYGNPIVLDFGTGMYGAAEYFRFKNTITFPSIYASLKVSVAADPELVFSGYTSGSKSAIRANKFVMEGTYGVLGESVKKWTLLYIEKFNNGNDIIVPTVGGKMAVQISTMPTAASTNEGEIYQYVGATDSTYTNGYFYKCVSDGGATPIYSWEQIYVQPASGGSVAIDGTTIEFNSLNEIQASAVVDQNTGIVKTWTGTAAEYDAIVTKDPDTEYIITDDIGDSATIIGEITEDVNELKAHEVIAFQAPTAQNNYTWYRKYADGWVEQGGQTISSAGNTAKNITFPVAMVDTNYTAQVTIHADLPFGSPGTNPGVDNNQTTTGMTIYSGNTGALYWEVKGMAA
jgi:hypothetical protein